jgi:tRNA1Val (adenine37-N6)-methyltransferase
MKDTIHLKYFDFKEFTIWQNNIGMPLTTDSVILGALANHSGVNSVLDIGSGTGILGLMMAQRFTNANIHAIEIDADAVDLAKHNFLKSKYANQLSVFHSSIQVYARKNKISYDLIISNPPYYQNYSLSANIKKQMARQNVSLDYAELAFSIAALSNDFTVVWMIIPYYFRNELITEMIRNGFFPYRFISIKSRKMNEYNRIVLAFSQISRDVQKYDLTIFNENNEYSCEFRELTKSFYTFF